MLAENPRGADTSNRGARGVMYMPSPVHRPQHFRRIVLVAGVSLGVAELVLSGSASAAKVRRSGPAISFVASNGEINTVAITAGLSSYLVTDSTATLVAGPGCSSIDPHNASCSVPSTGIGRVTINASDLDDVVVVNDAGAARYNIVGGTGQDDLTGGSGSDTIDGGADDDTIDGGGGNDSLKGGSGNADDTIHGGPGDDRLYGGAGDDALYGDAGDDKLLGGSGVDHLYGGADDDILDGEVDADFLFGESGNDWLLGGFANDTLDGGSGSDTLEGQGGNNTYVAHDGELDMIKCLGSGTDDYSNRDIVMPVGPDLLSDQVFNCP